MMNLFTWLIRGDPKPRPLPLDTPEGLRDKERRTKRLENRVSLLEARVTALQDILTEDGDEHAE